MQAISTATLRRIQGLGYGGLLPFIGLALLVVWPPSPHWQAFATEGLGLYAVTILSFVGAVSWGIALADPSLNDDQRARLLVFSVMPSLLTWLIWMTLLGAAQLLAFTALTLIVFLIDRIHGRALAWPAEWLRLRQHLSLTVSFFLLLAATGISLDR
ncbi:MAG: DUF3429 domain-containing protein [Burkholderiaceae bacterium]|jgi:hypothetical protein